MITKLKVHTSELNIDIEVDGDGFKEMHEAFLSVLGNPDVRTCAGLPSRKRASSPCMRTPETEGNSHEWDMAPHCVWCGRRVSWPRVRITTADGETRFWVCPGCEKGYNATHSYLEDRN